MRYDTPHNDTRGEGTADGEMKPLLHEAVVSWMNRNHKIVFRTKVFPMLYTFERVFDIGDKPEDIFGSILKG